MCGGSSSLSPEKVCTLLLLPFQPLLELSPLLDGDYNSLAIFAVKAVAFVESHFREDHELRGFHSSKRPVRSWRSLPCESEVFIRVHDRFKLCVAVVFMFVENAVVSPNANFLQTDRNEIVC